MASTFVDNLYSGQGKVYLAKRSAAGLPLALYWVGNCPKLEVQLTATRRKHQESYSGNRLVDKVQTTVKEGRFALTLEDIQKKNFALLVGGDTVALASGSYSATNFDTFASSVLVAQDLVKLTKPNVSSLVIKDSAGSAATLVANTDYEIVDAGHGIVRILNIGSYVQPFKAQYSYGATDVVTGFTADDAQEWYAYFAGLNTEANPDQRIGVEVYRIVFDPAKSLNLISNDQGSFDLEGEILRDNTKASDPNYGGFFRELYVDANL